MDNNIYSDPEKFDLEIVYECDSGGSYDFDKLVIWKKKNGDLLYDTDSGCSCPIPFEGVGLPDLCPATPEAIREWFEERWKANYNTLEPGELEKALALFPVAQ